MVDITHKKNSLRIATAQAIVKVGSQATIEAINNKQVPKGDVFEMSKAAGLLGVKKTPELLPDCHPLPIEYTGFEYEINGLEIQIKCTVKTIYKTGVEVEAMHGASVVALNMYDMLKPIDKQVSIEQIKLLSKTGGKSDVQKIQASIQGAVIVCSDSISKGEGEDKAGKALCTLLEQQGVSISNYDVISDDRNGIQERAKTLSKAGVQLILFCGGTGISPRDNTPDALIPLLDKQLPGVEEAMRAYGQERTSFAMFSRSVAGLIGESLVLALPGSTKGATESLEAVFPTILHLFDVVKGKRH
ncbi:MAG: bifunctional molybdenum cofactor biosynthesis protein MoaC/MoaB [Flavobacteriaceae bacterium]|jgi:cyclic pyranopterin phosphate synthase|nr:bifunctional molybdenum cofactor biosynthesis protein MoaC/MoaB [Flavobacteriaceae bacterium]NVJ72764.1 bifunctional molybdenum cofactor biosynthesis protein MoaC/MoaB [Flavobacteriaceae bacterium]